MWKTCRLLLYMASESVTYNKGRHAYCECALVSNVSVILFVALGENLKNSWIYRISEEQLFGYTRRRERQRVEQDSGLAGLPSLSKPDQRIGQDVAFMGTAQAREPQAGVLGL